MSDLQLTEDQSEALKTIHRWLQNTCSDEGCEASPEIHVCKPKELVNPFFVLAGYPGTGKSYCISNLVKDPQYGLKPEKVCFTAPTNKALRVLADYLDAAEINSHRATIYSLLGLSLQANGEVKELRNPEEPVDLSPYDLIVVDEASMVNKFLMAAIHEAVESWSVPFLFMGDPAQLPPVGEITSPIWAISNSFQLTKVLRYGNAILDLATSIRSVVDHPFPSVKISTNPPVLVLPKPQFQAAILADLDSLRSGDSKVIAWRNVTVGTYNQIIRKAIFGAEAVKETWLPTDKIVATAHLKDLDDNTFMRTDEEAVIEKVAIGRHPKHTEYEIYNILAKLDSGKLVTLRVLTTAGQFDLSNKLNELSMEAKSGKRYLWRQFWQLKEAFHEIKHAYAITSHRSQGSSYTSVYVDREDILLNHNRNEAFRSLYVSVTRARERVVML